MAANPVIEYYFSFISSWSYIGSRRFAALVRDTGAEVVLKPIDLMHLFSVSGGVPVKDRAPQRQAYRLLEMERWKRIRGDENGDLPINKHPKFYPADPSLAHRVLLAAIEEAAPGGPLVAGSPVLEFVRLAMQTVWADEADIADPDTIVRVATKAGLDGQRLLGRATGEAGLKERENALTEEAVERRFFGAPTYVYRGEPFWGQDRLEMLNEVITQRDGREALALPTKLD